MCQKDHNKRWKEKQKKIDEWGNKKEEPTKEKQLGKHNL